MELGKDIKCSMDDKINLKNLKFKRKRNYIVDVQDDLYLEEDEDLHFMEKRVFHIDDF
jgi:hypothetical protein